MIRYEVGDATNPPMRPVIIAHVCNDEGRWGAGFSGAVSRRWAEPEVVYRVHHRTVGLTLGTIQLAHVADGVDVANMVAQHGIRRRPSDPPAIRYDALRTCLEQVATAARNLGATLVMPRIGAGLAGGDWTVVEPIIRHACDGVPAVVYDLPQR